MLWIIMAVHFILDFSTSIFQPLGPYITEKFFIDPRTYAIALYTISLTSNLTQPLFGVISDNVGKRNLYIAIVAALTILFSSFISVAGTFWIFVAFVFIAQISNSAFHPMGATIAGHRYKEHIAFFSLAGIFGYAAGPVFITWYAEKYDLKGMYIIGLVLSIFAFIFLSRMKFFEREKKEKKRISLNAFKVLLPVFFYVAFRSFSMGIVQVYGPMYVNTLGMSLVFGGSLLTFTRIAGMVLSTLGVYIGKKIGNSVINVISASLMVAFGLVFSLLDFAQVPAWVLAVIFVSMLSPAYLTMSSTVVEAQDRLPHNPGVASSVVMGFAAAMGNLMNLLYSSVFGNNVKFMVGSFWFISVLVLGAATWDFIYEKSRQ
ncbi:MAG: MFS transporter [Thermotogaceae bacterium]|nr:MFS transporter [Thermotogaceae bacterium]